MEHPQIRDRSTTLGMDLWAAGHDDQTLMNIVIRLEGYSLRHCVRVYTALGFVRILITAELE
jgi:hypothetical protein